MSTSEDILKLARELLANESQALGRMVEALDEEFVQAVHQIHRCEGRVIATGIGKAGIVARKVAATLASTGSPADYLHPTDALHGDLGRVSAHDIVLAFSNSGTTEEILSLVGPLKNIGAKTIAVTAGAESPLARHADIVLDYGTVAEAGPLGLAPTTSTTVMMALGDALAMSVLKERDFTPEEFARYHPAGNLGRSLMRVEEVMRSGDALPLIFEGSSLEEAVEMMTSTPGRPGCVVIVDDTGAFAGIYTDGDLRRHLLETENGGPLNLSQAVGEVMTREAITVHPLSLVGEAQRLLRERRIDQLAVLDDNSRPVGLFDVQDLLGVHGLA